MAENQKEGVNSSWGGNKNRSMDLQLAIDKILKDIDLVINALRDLKGPAFDNRLEVYREKAYEVGRYSFRSHLRID